MIVNMKDKAKDLYYDNKKSGLNSTNPQDAIDEVSSKVDQIAGNQIPEEYLESAVDEYVKNNSAGFATQVNLEELDSQLSGEIAEVITSENLSWNNGWINSNGVIVESEIYQYSEPFEVKAYHRIIANLTASESVACICRYENDLYIPLAYGGSKEFRIDGSTENCMYVVCGNMNNTRSVKTIFDTNSSVLETKKIESELNANIFTYRNILELVESGNGFYNISGELVNSDIYKHYRLTVDKGETVLIHAKATSSVACIAMFDSSFTTMDSVLVSGHQNDGGLHDYLYNTQEKSYIMVSSHDVPIVQYISKNNNNTYSVNEWTEGYYINPLGVTVADTNYKYSRMFPLRKGDSLNIKNLLVNKNTCTVGIYDNQTLLKDVTLSIKKDDLYTSDFVYTAENSIEYIRVCTQISANTEITIIENGINARAKIYDNPLEGKTFNIIGDSYVAGEGMGINNTWAGLIATKYGMTYRNYGRGGMQSQWMIENIPNMDDNADYIGCICGKNDYNAQIPIDTFKANIATICDLLINKYLGKKIFLGTPWRISEATEVAVGGMANSITLQEYVDAMIEVCGEKSVPCFDASRKSGVFIDNANFRAMYMKHANDVSHLNIDGFKYVTPKYEAFMLTL